MRIGVLILPEFPWSTARNLWRHAEELGFDHAWTYDHLAWRSLRDSPWFAAIPTLTAAATATERIRLGTLVASPNYRHPVPFAKELITLDDVSAGIAEGELAMLRWRPRTLDLGGPECISARSANPRDLLLPFVPG